MPKKVMNNQKLRNKIEKLILKYEKKTLKEEKQLKISKKTELELKQLLEKIPKESNETNKELSQELNAIHKNFKNEMKKLKKEAKKERKERKSVKSNKRKVKKEEKVKKQFQLENSRVEELPEMKENDLESFTIIVDGWNITGCDTIARKSMRGKRGKGAKRMINLLKNFGLQSQFMKVNGKNVNLEIHFDGNGKSRVEIFDSLKIPVKYSGKQEIVDDRLVRELSLNVSNNSELVLNNEIPFKVLNNPNRIYLVVTSDRELTLRLNAIGVSCMKSGCFYKKYLKEFEFCDLELNEEKELKESKIKNEMRKEFKNENNSEKNPKKSKNHWKKYIKNRFSDNSSSSNSSSDSSNSSSSSDNEE